MTSAEFTRWLALYTLEPFGSQADDTRFGTLATAISAPWGGKTEPGEWFPWRPKPEPSGDWRDLQVAMAAFAATQRAAGVAGHG